MQRRDLLRFASGLIGIAAGLTLLAASANAAPLAPAVAELTVAHVLGERTDNEVVRCS